MKLESTKVKVNKSAKDLFNYLLKLENFEGLMPENMDKFEVDGNSFLFSLKGMPEIRLVIKEKNPFKNILFGAASSKLNFSLDAQLNELSENQCEAQLLFEGDFNPMMAMMIKNPLQKFINTLVENASKL